MKKINLTAQRSLVLTGCFFLSTLVLTIGSLQASPDQCVNIFGSAPQQQNEGSNPATQKQHSRSTAKLITESYFDLKGDRAKPRIDDVISILSERKTSEAEGVMLSRYSEEHSTRFYFAGSSRPDRNMQIPLVDPESKAVFIFIHGSGTAASSGKNFYAAMNQLAVLGFSAVGFDLPFHAHGPHQDAFKSADHFMTWLRGIVLEIKKSGKPVYFVGHSFGPDVIAEYLTRYPFDVEGGVLLSPAGFTKTLSDWYEKYTTKMQFGADVVENPMGGLWAGQMSQQFIWNKPGAQDPTRVNPKLKVTMMSGAREEYVPAPIGGSKKTPVGDNTYDIGRAFKRFFSGATTVIEPGVGHYIFSHNDKDGVNIVYREILKIVGLDARQMNELRKQWGLDRNNWLTPTYRISQAYASDRVFQAWVSATIGARAMESLIRKENDTALIKIFDDYQNWSTRLNERVIQAVLSTGQTLPKFFQLYQKQITALANAKKKDVSLNNLLLDYLSNLPETELNQFLNSSGLDSESLKSLL